MWQVSFGMNLPFGSRSCRSAEVAASELVVCQSALAVAAAAGSENLLVLEAGVAVAAAAVADESLVPVPGSQ